MMISLTALAFLLGASTTFDAARAQDPASYHVEIRDGNVWAKLPAAGSDSEHAPCTGTCG